MKDYDRQVPREMSHDALHDEVHRLVTRMLEAPGGDEQAELEKLLKERPDAQHFYIHYMQETASLREYANGGAVLDLQSVSTDKPPAHLPDESINTSWGIDPRWFSYAAAAVILLAVGYAGFRAASNEDRAVESDGIATVTRLLDVEWSLGQGSVPAALTRVGSGQSLRFDSGQVEVVFDTGVELLVNGPADLQIESPLRVCCSRGAVTARVGENGKGFTVRTPVTDVIDLGTEFGVRIDEDGKTGVAVFDGKVDVSSPAEIYGEPTQKVMRLRQGDAIAVTPDGRRQRLVSISSSDFPDTGRVRNPRDRREVLIEGVSDNIVDPRFRSFYKVVRDGLTDDAQAFVDRRHEWNGIDESGVPASIRGAEYVMPFNNRKYHPELVVSVDLARSCRLFVLLDNRVDVPTWLSSSFEDTGEDIGLDQAYSKWSSQSEIDVGPGRSVDSVFSIWARDILQPGRLTLGSVKRPKGQGWNMFGIAAKPLDEID